MAYKFTIPFYAFRLHLHAGGNILVPMGKEEAIRIGQSLPIVAQQYASALQEQILDKGELSDVLNEFKSGDFIQALINVSFPAAKDALAYPDFSLEFPFYYNVQERGYWAILPTLQMEAFSRTPEGLEQKLEEAIRLDFKRNKRLQTVQDIVSTMWYESIELKQEIVQLEAPSPKELESMMKNQQGKLLPKVAILLDVSDKQSYGTEETEDQFEKLMKSKFFKNVLLIGPSGVGKTALVWEIARQLKKKRSKTQIWETSASVLIKELMKDTGWQENLTLLCQELAGTTNILFVRNLMDLFEVGKSEGNSISMAEFLKPFLGNGSLKLISECTEEELAQIEVKNANLINLFQKINVREPQSPVLEEIIQKKVEYLAWSQQLSIQKVAIQEAIRLNRRFTPYAGMPGKPIRFLESLLLNQKVGGQAAEDISRKEVLAQFCEETGMPQFIIDPDIPLNISQVKTQFNDQLYGQEAAVNQVADVLATVKAALTKLEKPIASFLFVGPTGVGKTELAKILAEFMFGSRDRMTRFDMSEYSNPYNVGRLIGNSHSGEGLLTSAIRKEPFSVLLFDEIEKADSTFFDLLLQLLSEGRLTDNKGQLTSFCSTIIIMTSNIGAQNMVDPIGWQKELSGQSVETHFMSEVQKYFRPELFNRIDKVIPFTPLDSLSVRFVVEREMEILKKREGIQFRRMSLQLSEEVLDYLAEKGYDGKYGARHLQRTIREELVVPLSRELNSQDIDDQLEVQIVLNGNKIDIQTTSDPLGLELLLEEYSKISHADHASNLRRRIERLTEGHFYIQLLNELDIMERKRKVGKQSFWKDRNRAEKYAYYLDIKQGIENLLEETESLETRLGLSCIGPGVYNPKWADELEQFEEQFFGLKTTLYSRLNPKSNYCHIGIYGPEAHFVIDFYIELLKSKGFEYQGYSIWYRESYYYEEVLVDEENVNGSKKARKAYFKRDYHPENEKSLVPPKEEDVLWGVELAITGPCAWLYIKEESGIQKWSSGDEESLYLVKVENNSFETPSRIHRKEFYLSSPVRRHIDETVVKDAVYKISREYNKTALITLFVESLDQRFKICIDKETI